MFRRPARLYRRARRYGKKRVGLSFVQKGSKARYGTSLATTWPFSKRSASSAGMSQNMSEDDWKELGRNAPQSGAGADAPLSKVRFLRPNASVLIIIILQDVYNNPISRFLVQRALKLSMLLLEH